jgi:hypothetical protein
MYQISFEQPCSKSMTATYTIFNREHAGVTPVNTWEFRRKQKIFTELIVRTADRQTDVINTFHPISFFIYLFFGGWGLFVSSGTGCTFFLFTL